MPSGLAPEARVCDNLIQLLNAYLHFRLMVGQSLEDIVIRFALDEPVFVPVYTQNALYRKCPAKAGDCLPPKAPQKRREISVAEALSSVSILRSWITFFQRAILATATLTKLSATSFRPATLMGNWSWC